MYDRLFLSPEPEAETREAEPGGEENESSEDAFLSFVNRNSLQVTRGYVEPSITWAPSDTRYQFERTGYFWRDPIDGQGDTQVFNRIITLRDSWTKEVGRNERQRPSVTRKRKEPEHTPRAPATLTPKQQAEMEHYTAQNISESDASVLVREPKLAAFLAQAAQGVPYASLASWIVNDLGRSVRDDANRVTPSDLAALVKLVQDGVITIRIGKDALSKAQDTGVPPVEIVEREGLRAVSDVAILERIIDRVMIENPDKVAAYRAGRHGLMGFFTGQVMSATSGQASPHIVAQLLSGKLNDAVK